MEPKTIVHVIAWEYPCGGGFDWYRTPKAADVGWKEEKKNADDPALTHWVAARFTFKTSHNPNGNEDERQKITDEIDAKLPELFDAAKIKYAGENTFA